MRISVDKDDPGFRNFILNAYEVWLNGGRLKDCVTADEEMGLVVVLALGPDKEYLVQDGKCVERTLRGRVEISTP